ncbi:MAG TPA: hypothetical protein VFP23_03820 [Solirubrobacterales bacterium]|nr:hypothetical protein [Solirubrobacterales bacterium]
MSPSLPPPVLAALFDLSHPAHYVRWHFFQMSVANVIVILLMIAVFAAAILIPFRRGEHRS